MLFDPWRFEPPLGEFRDLLSWFIAALCLVGWVSAALSVLRRRASSVDWKVWMWALLGGGVAGAGLVYWATRQAEPDPFVTPFIEWLVGSAFGAGLLVWVGWRDRRELGCRIIQAASMFVLGVPVLAFGSVVVFRAFFR